MTAIPTSILAGGSPIVSSDRLGHPPAMGAGPVERIQTARAALPCPTCAHRPVCGIRERLEAAQLAVRAPDSPHPAVRVSVAVSVACDHYLADPDAPAATPEPAPIRRTEATIAESRKRGAQVIHERAEARRNPGRSEAWTPERRAAQSERIKAVTAARKASEATK